MYEKLVEKLKSVSNWSKSVIKSEEKAAENPKKAKNAEKRKNETVEKECTDDVCVPCLLPRKKKAKGKSFQPFQAFSAFQKWFEIRKSGKFKWRKAQKAEAYSSAKSFDAKSRRRDRRIRNDKKRRSRNCRTFRRKGLNDVASRSFTISTYSQTYVVS